jgi:DNA-binding NtrC family response regulator
MRAIERTASALAEATKLRIVLITGEDGCGKSLLANDLATKAKRGGDAVHVAASVEDTRRLLPMRKSVVIVEDVDGLPHPLQRRLARRVQSSRSAFILTSRLDDDEGIGTLGLAPTLAELVDVRTLRIPSLRQRPVDVEMLARRMLRHRYALDEGALAKLQAQAWVGNCRALRLALAGAAKYAADAGDKLITSGHLETALAQSATSTASLRAALVAESCSTGDALEDGSLREITRLVEAALIAQALREARGNVAMAGRRLRSPHSTLKSRIAALKKEIDAVRPWIACAYESR